MIWKIVLVFCGGGMGSIVRFLIGRFATRQWGTTWPVGIWIVNTIGSLAIGLLAGYLIRSKLPGFESLQLLLITGFCGGFTTFSAFSYENFILLEQKMYLPFFMYSFLSISVGIFFVLLGLRMIT